MADKTPFVLVHGAWHGAWCWSRVLPLLWQAGHAAHAITLTGLGERAEQLTREITLETHIHDAMNFIVAQEFESFVLVVHSYAGMIGTAVADRMQQKSPGRMTHLVYIDAAIPTPGESWSSRHSAATKIARMESARTSTLNAFPVPDSSSFGLSGADAKWVARRMTPHPAEPYTHALDFDMDRVGAVARTFVDCVNPPLGTIDASRARVRDPHFWGGAWAPKAHIEVLDTSHDAMITEPEALAKILLNSASL